MTPRRLRPAPIVRAAQVSVLIIAAGGTWAAFQAPPPADLGDWIVLVIVAATGPGLAAAVFATRIEVRRDRLFVRVIGRRFDIYPEEILSVDDGRRGPVVRTEGGVPEGWTLVHRSERERLAGELRAMRAEARGETAGETGGGLDADDPSRAEDQTDDRSRADDRGARDDRGGRPDLNRFA